jgi:hypothetical protein
MFTGTMMWPKLQTLLLVLVLSAARALATWSTLYTWDNQQVYVLLDDNSLWSFPGNVTNLLQSDVSSNFTSLTSPPDNATLAIDGTNRLLAVFGDGSSCQASPIQVSAYDPVANQWNKIATSPGNWYLENSTVWVQRDGMMYIYGGSCSGYSKVFNTLISFNVTSLEFQQVESSNSPTSLASAGVVRISPDSFLIVGGRSTNGWISMNQVAVWEYGTWSYRSALNSSGIDSRTDSLLLPLWDVEDEQTATSVLVIGGDVDGRPANPYLATLQLNSTSSWSWTAASGPAISGMDGALTLFQTLISVAKVRSLNLKGATAPFCRQY